MKLGNNKEFSSKDFIEFARRGPKSAEEKRNIKKGLKKFWDKKGRAVMTVGAGAAALGGITLAAKSGKIPVPGGAKSMNNTSKSLAQIYRDKGGIEAREVPMPGRDRSLSNLSQKTFKGKTYNQARGSKPRMGDTSAFTGGVDKQPRTIITPPPDGNQSMTVSGSSSQKIVSKVASTTKAAGKQAINRGREFRGAFDQGYAEGPKPGSAEDKIGRGLGKLVKRLKKANKRGYN